VVQVAEVTGTLSLATDLGMGLPFEHGLRRTLIAVALAEGLGVTGAERQEVYDVAQLTYIGCTAETYVFARFFGDELDAREAAHRFVWGRPSELQRVFLRRLGSSVSGPARLAAVLRALPDVQREVGASAEGHCEVAEMLAARLGLGGDHHAAFAALYERWDGKGFPGGLRGGDLPLSVRIVQVADDAAVQDHLGGTEHAARTIRERGGHAFDPALSGEFADKAERYLETARSETAWADVVAADPSVDRSLTGDAIDTALGAIADFADLKSPFLLGHSAGVASLAATAARRAGLGESAVAAVRRAGLVHDVGRVAVTVTTWDKGAPLSADDWERIRMHPYFSERILSRSDALRDERELAGAHHERLDGSGYHRGATAQVLPIGARILAAADAYHAMREKRPHRPALNAIEATRQLEAEALAGRLDGDAVSAVLEAAGLGGGSRGIPRPGGLTERETEILRLLAGGRMTKQVAHQLGISTKTADNHIQSIYRKIGVSTRAGATLYAMRNGLVGADI
jgi:HD-GYP domain-containing protein (c-di-GMP phosphodiesterase class II)/DNA-binding CsgD family transcriptional regulator